MSTLEKITNVWKNVQEVDLRPIRRAAEAAIRIAVVGRSGAGRRALAETLATDPLRPQTRSSPPIVLLDLDDATPTLKADLIVLLAPSDADDLARERAAVTGWSAAGRAVVVLLTPAGESPSEAWMGWNAAPVLQGPPGDPLFLTENLAPTVISLLPDQLLALGRNVPLFRGPICRKLINDTSFSNATYAVSTGIAEIVPALGVPLNIADIIVLTKAQALLVYRLGLVLGLPTDWQYYLGEFSGVVGGGFLWRQIARQLVGLIPVWGILPKAAVAYAGTYVVGQVVLRWYQTGRHLSGKEIRALYGEAYRQGREIARGLLDRVPRPRLFGRWRRRKALPAAERPVCPKCGAENDPDANYCKNCGEELRAAASPP